MKKKRFVFDLDGTLCSLTDGNYEKAIPFTENIKKLNQLSLLGDHITIFTARGMSRFNGDVHKAHEHFYALTRKQLIDWGVQYDDLILGKPSGDYYIDDKAIEAETFFNFYKRLE